MAELARAASRSGGGPPPEGPRFSLRFDQDGGALALARPFPFALGLVEHLELGLGALRFPLDLSTGPARFRTRRTRVRSASIRLEVAELLARVVEEPFELTPLRASPESMALGLRDAFGTIAFDIAARCEGPNLRLAVHGARSVLEAPAPPLARVLLAARALGMEVEEARGAFAVPRALSALLTEALVPYGWRVPDDRACRLRVEWLGPRRLRLRTLSPDEDEPSGDVAAWEAVHRLAPIVAMLAAGDVEGARAAYAALAERGASGAVRFRAASLDLDAPEEASDPSPPGRHAPVTRAIALRRALTEQDGRRAEALASSLADVEPCDTLAVEALCAAADIAAPAAAARLLSRAVARRPSDARIALRLIEALARLGLDDELRQTLDQTLATREPGPERGALARDAAAICEMVGEQTEADRLFLLAVKRLPTDARVLEGASAARQRAGELGAALEGFDRAAARYADAERPDDEARALRRAARVAEAAERLEGAETRWTRASRVRPDPSVFAALARVRLALGQQAAATRAEDRLLEHLGEALSPPDDVLEALARGADRALTMGRAARARAWTAALSRVRSDHPALPSLREALARLDEAEALERPAVLLTLTPARLVATLERAEDAGQALRRALEGAGDPPGALELLSQAAGQASGALAAALADAVAHLAEHAASPEALLAVEPLVTTPDARSALAEAAWERLRADGRPVDAALALARAGAAKRDTAMLRAALSAAERAGDKEAAKSIARLALGVVGSGPARQALEDVIERLERA